MRFTNKLGGLKMILLNEGEKKKMQELKEKLIQAHSASEVRYYEEEIHKLLQTAEERLRKCEQDIEELLKLANETMLAAEQHAVAN